MEHNTIHTHGGKMNLQRSFSNAILLFAVTSHYSFGSNSVNFTGLSGTVSGQQYTGVSPFRTGNDGTSSHNAGLALTVQNGAVLFGEIETSEPTEPRPGAHWTYNGGGTATRTNPDYLAYVTCSCDANDIISVTIDSGTTPTSSALYGGGFWDYAIVASFTGAEAYGGTTLTGIYGNSGSNTVGFGIVTSNAGSFSALDETLQTCTVTCP